MTHVNLIATGRSSSSRQADGACFVLENEMKPAALAVAEEKLTPRELTQSIDTVNALLMV